MIYYIKNYSASPLTIARTVIEYDLLPLVRFHNRNDLDFGNWCKYYNHWKRNN